MNNDDVETVENCPKSLAAWKHEVENLRSQLEAERQRADNLSELYHATEKAVFKIAKTIKGDAFDKYSHSTSQAIEVIGAELEVLREEKAKWVDYATQASNEVDKLKAKLANPVVLKPAYKQSDYNLMGLEPSDAYGLAWGSSATRDDSVKQIREAGFTVKGD
jgi:predicted  nucleic acid-binding Zn-ribbon protein